MLFSNFNLSFSASFAFVCLCIEQAYKGERCSNSSPIQYFSPYELVISLSLPDIINYYFFLRKETSKDGLPRLNDIEHFHKKIQKQNKQERLEHIKGERDENEKFGRPKKRVIIL